MGATRLVVSVAMATAFLSMGCDESKVPKAAVRNNLDECIVEAAWYDDGEDKPYGRAYGWVDAIGKGGLTPTREVVEGTGYAYAVLAPGSDCYAAAKLPGGTLWRTKERQQMTTGQTTVILFSTDTAEIVVADPQHPDICRFCRLGCCENSIKPDASTPEAGDDAAPDVEEDAEPDAEDAGADAEDDVVEAGDEPADDAAAD